jgi:GT2 family glycosyltransferase
MAKCAIIVTIFNRIDITLRFLESLQDAKNTIPQHDFQVFINNDGEKKDTETIKDKFPESHVIESDGTLFWNRGMINAWKYAISHSYFDYFILMNDDIELNKNAFDIMFESYNMSNSACIISCPFLSRQTGNVTYGGRDIKWKIITPNNDLQNITFLNCNCTLIPMQIVKEIGLLDPHFHHGHGDFDYGLRAIKKGYNVYLATDAVGFCEDKSSNAFPCFDGNIRLLERLEYLYSSPLGPNPLINYLLYYRHFGVISTIRFLLWVNFKTLFAGK